MTVIIGVILFIILLFILRIAAVKRRRRRVKEARRQAKIRELAREQMEIDEDRKRRNWTYSTSYEKIAPRTGDLRKEAVESELRQSRKDGSDSKSKSAGEDKQ